MENYRRVRKIGRGSYGEIWLVRSGRDTKHYVLKQINLQDASERERRSAQLEAQLLATLRHPNIVSYRDSFETGDGFLYIAMGYCEGGDLHTRIKQQRGIPFQELQILEWFIQICMALQYLHDRNILHRDLKTQNIFLTKSKIVKVGDLGIAKVLDGHTAMATTLIGTPYYMSPELFLNRPYNFKSDIWALGCCAYELTTLKHAFNARDINSLVHRIVRGKLPVLPNSYSDQLQDLIRAMLSHSPEKRPSVTRILRHPFIRKSIAVCLEGTSVLRNKMPAVVADSVPQTNRCQKEPDIEQDLIHFLVHGTRMKLDSKVKVTLPSIGVHLIKKPAGSNQVQDKRVEISSKQQQGQQPSIVKNETVSPKEKMSDDFKVLCVKGREIGLEERSCKNGNSSAEAVTCNSKREKASHSRETSLSRHTGAALLTNSSIHPMTECNIERKNAAEINEKMGLTHQSEVPVLTELILKTRCATSACSSEASASLSDPSGGVQQHELCTAIETPVLTNPISVDTRACEIRPSTAPCSTSPNKMPPNNGARQRRRHKQMTALCNIQLSSVQRPSWISPNNKMDGRADAYLTVTFEPLLLTKCGRRTRADDGIAWPCHALEDNAVPLTDGGRKETI